MKITAPKKNVFWIATVIAAVGLIASIVTIPVVSTYAFWILLVGFVLLWLGVALKGF